MPHSQRWPQQGRSSRLEPTSRAANVDLVAFTETTNNVETAVRSSRKKTHVRCRRGGRSPSLRRTGRKLLQMARRSQRLSAWLRRSIAHKTCSGSSPVTSHFWTSPRPRPDSQPNYEKACDATNTVLETALVMSAAAHDETLHGAPAASVAEQQRTRQKHPLTLLARRDRILQSVLKVFCKLAADLGFVVLTTTSANGGQTARPAAPMSERTSKSARSLGSRNLQHDRQNRARGARMHHRRACSGWWGGCG